MVLCGATAAPAVIIVGIILLAKGCSGGTDAKDIFPWSCFPP